MNCFTFRKFLSKLFVLCVSIILCFGSYSCDKENYEVPYSRTINILNRGPLNIYADDQRLNTIDAIASTNVDIFIEPNGNFYLECLQVLTGKYPDGTLHGYFNEEFFFTDCRIRNMGELKGLHEVNTIPSSGYSYHAPLEYNYGYIIQLRYFNDFKYDSIVEVQPNGKPKTTYFCTPISENVIYGRFYVEDVIYYEDSPDRKVKIKIQFPWD